MLTTNGDVVYDPFAGRGTTAIESGLNERYSISNDINPLSRILTRPRLFIPEIDEIEKRLKAINIDTAITPQMDLSMFYHKKTEAEINSLRKYLIEREREKNEDNIDRWIRMIATNRLSGHSSGFFSVYTLPPNQAVSPESQTRINERRKQKPDYRNIKELILRKSRSLLRNVTGRQIAGLSVSGMKSVFLTCDARSTSSIEDNSVQLTVTSPPFLDVVQYSKDNWLRCWFNDLDAKVVEKSITSARSLEEWLNVMQDVFHELYRITKPDGWVAFEVGEVRNGKIRLDEHVAPIGSKAGFTCECILINEQDFTKTANIWGVRNNTAGTNTNRIVVFKK